MLVLKLIHVSKRDHRSSGTDWAAALFQGPILLIKMNFNPGMDK